MRIFAYLDPGTGGMLLQVLLGGIAGALVAVKMFGRNLARKLQFWKRDETEAEQASSDPNG